MQLAGTIRSNGWKNAILEKIPHVQLQSIACPLLAPMVEEGWYDNEIAQLAIKEYLKPLSRQLEALILGCTHYPLLTNVIQKQIGNEVEIINIGTHVAKEIDEMLKQENIASQIQQPDFKIYLTDTEYEFNKVASNLLGKEVQAETVKEDTEFYTNY